MDAAAGRNNANAARPEGDSRAARCGKEHSEITASRASTPRDAAGEGREEEGGAGRPAGQRGVAGGASVDIFANLARRAGSSGRRGAAQQRWPHLRTPQARRETRKQRDVATARSQRRAQQRTATPRATDVKKTRPAGQQGVAGGESRDRLANLAGGAGNFGRRGAAQRRGPHLCTPQDRSKTCEQRNVASRTAQSQRSAHQHTVTPRETDELGTPRRSATA